MTTVAENRQRCFEHLSRLTTHSRVRTIPNSPHHTTPPKTTATMRFLRSLVPSLLLLGAGVAEAASWGFDEAVISVAKKGNAGSAFKDKYVVQDFSAQEALEGIQETGMARTY